MARRWRSSLLVLGTLAAVASTAVTATPANAIVGGTPVNWSAYPYFAEVSATGNTLQETSICGGTVIAPTWILTAAHCLDLDGVVADRVHVALSNGQFRTATSLAVHPLWNGDATDGHDLALVRVPAVATAGITPIQVGAPGDPGAYAANTEATFVGIGLTAHDAPPDYRLRAVDTPIRSDDYMDDIFNRWYWFDQWIEDLMIGAGSTAQTFCHGDSGGPLIVSRNDHLVQVGVVSGGITGGCDTAGASAELAGAQLAWVANLVPQVKAAWGGCTQPNGSPGQPAVHYSTAYEPNAQMDGRYYWSFQCVDLVPPMSVFPVGDYTSTVLAPYAGTQSQAGGGYPPYTWSIAGLPPGATYSTATGAVSGAPTQIGDFTVLYTATDSRGQSATGAFTWTVTERETRLFTGSATASKPTTAQTAASTKARNTATGAGFGNCELIDSTVEPDEFGGYVATATLRCSR